MAAGIVGIISTFITFGIGTQVLGWSPTLVLWAIVASNIAAWCCLPVTLMSERVAWFKRYIIPDMVRTWVFFAGLYFLVLLLLLPEIREPHAFVRMILPVIGTTGYMIWIYGPVHDFFIRRSQLKARARAKTVSG